MRRWAKAGLLLGALAAAGIGVFAPPALRDAAERRRGRETLGALRTLRRLCTAQAVFREGPGATSPVPRYARSFAELVDAGLLPPEGLARGQEGGYVFGLNEASHYTWSAHADPIDHGGIPRFLFMDESGVVRFSTTGRATAEAYATSLTSMIE